MNAENLYKCDDGAMIRIWQEAAKNNFQSDRHGRPIYDQVLMGEVYTPGSKESSPAFELERSFCDEAARPEPRRSTHFQKYGAQIEAFRRNDDSAEMRGTPLSAWPALDSARVASLRDCRVFTVEGLAALTDGNLKALGPGGMALREQAKSFLAAAAGNAPTAALTAELADAREQIALMQEQIKALQTPVVEPGVVPNGTVTVNDKGKKLDPII